MSKRVDGNPKVDKEFEKIFVSLTASLGIEKNKIPNTYFFKNINTYYLDKLKIDIEMFTMKIIRSCERCGITTNDDENMENGYYSIYYKYAKNISADRLMIASRYILSMIDAAERHNLKPYRMNEFMRISNEMCRFIMVGLFRSSAIKEVLDNSGIKQLSDLIYGRNISVFQFRLIQSSGIGREVSLIRDPLVVQTLILKKGTEFTSLKDVLDKYSGKNHISLLIENDNVVNNNVVRLKIS